MLAGEQKRELHGIEALHDAAIELEQYKAHLGIRNSTETVQDEHCSDVLMRMEELVEEQPEIVTFYANALKNYRKTKPESVASERAVIDSRIDLLEDLEVISNNRIQRQRDRNRSGELVYDEAKLFFRMFKHKVDPSAVPKDRYANGSSVNRPQRTKPKVFDTLRAGQEPVLQDLLDYISNKGIQGARGHVIAPTGSGKTVIFAKLLEHLRLSGELPTTAIVVPTIQLEEQTAKELERHGFHGNVELGRNQRTLQNDTDIVITTQAGFVRKLQRRSPGMDPEKIKFIIFDEAHHIGGEFTQIQINSKLDHAGIIGFTASPDYDSKRVLRNHLPDKIHEISVQEGIDLGLIAPYQTILLPTHGDLRQVVPVATDYHQTLLSRAIESSPRNHLIARFVADHLLEKLVVFNVNTVEHAETLAETIRQYGKKVIAVSQGTKNLSEILEAFHTGEITGLVHARLLTEGFDETEVDAVVNVAPTLSDVREKQRTGRGQRISKSKPKKVLSVVECIDDNYVKVPRFYGAINRAWHYPVFTPIDIKPAYGALQYEEEIEEWVDGTRQLKVDIEELAGNTQQYTPTEIPEVLLDPEGSSTDSNMGEVHSIVNYNLIESKETIEDLLRLGNPAVEHIITGEVSISEDPTIDDARKALRLLAGHDSLRVGKIYSRYMQVQEAVAGHARLTRPAGVAISHTRGLLPEKPSWNKEAQCREESPDSFFPKRGQSTSEAKEVCGSCAVNDDCLEFSFLHGIKHGIWGGLSERQRRAVRRVQRSGEASAEELRVFINSMRQVKVEQEDELDDIDELMEAS